LNRKRRKKERWSRTAAGDSQIPPSATARRGGVKEWARASQGLGPSVSLESDTGGEREMFGRWLSFAV
jgi:hypothetical protein